MTTVEKMARAISAEMEKWDDSVSPEPYIKKAALAALKAIREPSEGMAAAGTARDDGADPTNAAGVFTAMIDHAIQEHEG